MNLLFLDFIVEWKLWLAMAFDAFVLLLLLLVRCDVIWLRGLRISI